MNCNNILGITVNERREHSAEIQAILTKHGCEIVARLGLPQQERDTCTNKGLMVLVICDPQDAMEAMVKELNEISSVNAQYMTM